MFQYVRFAHVLTNGKAVLLSRPFGDPTRHIDDTYDMRTTVKAAAAIVKAGLLPKTQLLLSAGVEIHKKYALN